MKSFPRRTAQPSVEPLTVAEVLHHLRQDDLGAADTAYIVRLIRAARMACEERTDRTLISTPWRLHLDDFPDAIELLMPPVISVASVQFLDADGVSQTLAAIDYQVDTARQPGWIVPAPGRAWPAVFEGINAVTVNYVAGYGATAADVPEPLIHWMLLAIGEMYATRNAGSDKPQVSHQFADALLQPYRLVGV